MNKNILDNIEKLIINKKIEQAQIELSKLGSEFLKIQIIFIYEVKFFILTNYTILP